jgi:protein-S-isoprenylcysteine O-methyltransferase Ste14
MDNLMLEILVLAGIILAFVNIFLFKKRKTQIKVGYLLVILSILIPVVAYLYFTNQATTLEDSTIEDGPGIYLPIAALVFALLANRFIRKDEKLVRSIDRLR